MFCGTGVCVGIASGLVNTVGGAIVIRNSSPIYSPSASGNVVDFEKYRNKLSDKSSPGSCDISDDDGNDSCKKEQIKLMSQRTLLAHFYNQGYYSNAVYLQVARVFNTKVETHNTFCPSFPVQKLPVGPGMY